jgi:hypothetical protein
LNSIGGYHAAKLRRYQDLIDEHISREMNPFLQTVMRTQGFMLPDENAGKDFAVLNMLNMKYAVVPTQGSRQVPVMNPYAMGNCWFVDEVILVDTPDEECAALRTIDLYKQAVADKKFATELGLYGILIAVVTLVGYYIGLEDGAKTASTMAFATLTLARLFHGFTCRSDKSIVKLGILSNKWSLGAFGAGVILLGIVLFVPFMHGLFVIAPIDMVQTFWIIGLAAVPTLLVQIYRSIRECISKK